MNIFILCLLSVISFSRINVGNCEDVQFFRSDYKYSKQDKAFYKKHNMALSWTNAVCECESEGAELAWPLYVDDIGDLKPLTATHEEFWIGIHSLNSPPNVRTFSNLDGELAHEINNYGNETNVYLDDTEGKDCIFMQNSMFSNDYCQNYKKFICLAHTGSNPENTPLSAMFRSDYIWMKNLEFLIKIHNELKTWLDARRSCAAEGSRLLDTVAPSDLNELTAVLEPGTYWTGDQLHINEYSRQMAENNRQPGKMNCFTMDGKGRQQASRCDTKYKFICQKTQLSSTNHLICRDGNSFLRRFSSQNS